MLRQARQAEQRRKRTQQLSEQARPPPQDQLPPLCLGALPLGLGAARPAVWMCMRVHHVERDVHGAACESGGGGGAVAFQFGS